MAREEGCGCCMGPDGEMCCAGHLCSGCKAKEDREGLRDRIDKAVQLATKYGGIDGAHHKAWVIDQMVRVLAGKDYADIVRVAKAGEDGPDTYAWDEGIAP